MPTFDLVEVKTEALDILRMVLDGRISGRISEWPQIKPAIAEVIEQVEALRRDAERYRWLRARDIYDLGEGPHIADRERCGASYVNYTMSAETADTRIDAARHQEATNGR